MIYNFTTDNELYARCALLLYGLYRSRDEGSPLNGLETWRRFNSFVLASCEEAENVPEFIQRFCRKAGIGAIVRKWLDDGGDALVEIGDAGIVALPDMCSVKLQMYDDPDVLDALRRYGQFIILLVRDRIEREAVKNKLNPDREG